MSYHYIYMTIMYDMSYYYIYMTIMYNMSYYHRNMTTIYIMSYYYSNMTIYVHFEKWFKQCSMAKVWKSSDEWTYYVKKNNIIASPKMICFAFLTIIDFRMENIFSYYYPFLFFSLKYFFNLSKASQSWCNKMRVCMYSSCTK